MPIEIRRFGVGHRRPDGPPGTVGLSGQLIHSDERGLVSEFAFARGAHIEPHTNPNTTWFVVIEGGGWVGVGDERTRVAAGEAVLWPADVTHGAWTEHSEMRAIVVEFAGPDDADVRGLLAGRASDVDPATGSPVGRGEGALAERATRSPHDGSSGEPA
jgi:quercetin dioxygenase-like cupin family protein